MIVPGGSLGRHEIAALRIRGSHEDLPGALLRFRYRKRPLRRLKIMNLYVKPPSS